jgi:hypothetical protein
MSRSAKAEIKSLVESGLDWECVIREANRQRTVSSLYSCLKTLGENDVPAFVLNRLREIYVITTNDNMRREYELAGILRALEHKGISVMLLKGVALMQILDRHTASRAMWDIDILVREYDLCDIQATLHEFGYDLRKPLPNVTARGLVEYAHCFDQIKFFNKNGAEIDTHFRLLDMGDPSAEQPSAWERALPLRIDEANALVPCPEDMLLHLCFHANHHWFAKIYYFCDIAGVLERYAEKFDWGYLLEVAERRKMKTSVYYTLLLTRDLLGAPVPLGVLDRLETSYLRRKLFECVWERILVKYRSRLRRGNFGGPMYYILEMDGLRERLGFIVKCLFPSVEWLSLEFCLPQSKKLYFRYLLSLVMRCLRPAT